MQCYFIPFTILPALFSIATTVTATSPSSFSPYSFTFPAYPSPSPAPSQESSTKGQHPDIVVLRWPAAKLYDPAAAQSIDDDEILISTTTLSPIASEDELERRQDFSNAVHLVVPQSADPSNPSDAPLPPHPYYRGNSADADNHSDDEDENDDDPETQWQKLRDKIRLKPVNHQIFKTDGKHVPTLPYAPTQPLYELQYGIDQIRRAVHKISPMAGLANDVFKKFNIAVKARIKNMRGPYGYSYPSGYYDHIYEADDNPEPSEPRPVFLEAATLSPDNQTSDYDDEAIANTTVTLTSLDKRSDRRYDPPITIPPPDPSNRDDLEQRSFGFKVTVYKTPQGKENITEELFDGDKHLVFHSPSAIPGKIQDDDKNIASEAHLGNSSISSSSNIDPMLSAAAGSSPHYLSSALKQASAPGNPFIRTHHPITTGNGEGGKESEHRFYYDKNSPLGLYRDSLAKQHDISAHEHKQKVLNKHQAGHDKRKAIEKALKETTVIEFFEREKVNDGEENSGDQTDGEDDAKKLYYDPKGDESRTIIHRIPFNNSDEKSASEKQAASITEYNYNPTRFAPPNHVHSKQRSKLHPKGWKEHGYRIIQEVEYLDRDAAQEKGFTARDRGNAEHVKDLQEKKKFNHHLESSSYGATTSPDQEDNPLVPTPPTLYTEQLPSIPYSESVSYKRKYDNWKIPPHTYTYSKAENRNRSISSSGYLIPLMGPSSSSAHQGEMIRPAESSLNMKRIDAPKLQDGFVEIVANLSFTTTNSPLTPYLLEDLYSSATATTTTTEAPRTTKKVYPPMRRPPNDSINALTIIESPKKLWDETSTKSHRNGTSAASSQWNADQMQVASTSSKKFSKIISIDDPTANKRIHEAQRMQEEFMKLLTNHNSNNYHQTNHNNLKQQQTQKVSLPSSSSSSSSPSSSLSSSNHYNSNSLPFLLSSSPQLSSSYSSSSLSPYASTIPSQSLTPAYSQSSSSSSLSSSSSSPTSYSSLTTSSFTPSLSNVASISSSPSISSPSSSSGSNTLTTSGSIKSYYYPMHSGIIAQYNANPSQQQNQISSSSEKNNNHNSNMYYQNPVKSDDYYHNHHSEQQQHQHQPQGVDHMTIQKLIHSLQTTDALPSSPSKPLTSLSSAFGTYTRPSVFQSITSSGKSVISRLKRPLLSRLPSTIRMKFLPFSSSSANSMSEEQRQEEEVIKQLAHMDTEKIIANLLGTSTGERRNNDENEDQDDDNKKQKDKDKDPVSNFLDNYLYATMKKEIEDRSDLGDQQSYTGISPSLLNHVNSTSPSGPSQHAMKRMAPLYSQPLVLKHESQARKLIEALRKSFWIADESRRRSY